MTLRLGDTAPDFTASSTQGEIRFHDWIDGSWAVLFSHPKDFTPVCTTELGAVARLKPEFDRRGVKVLGLSVDGVIDHEGWSRDIEATQGVALNFPLIADKDRSIATTYDMLDPTAEATQTVRSVFVIDPAKKIRLTLTYPASTGRDFGEILRAIDSLQLTSSHQVATPANWRNGDDVIILASLTDDQARERFPDGWRADRPYLRYVPDPSARA
jgi:thioredoxin-dependent peroxiredoxin